MPTEYQERYPFPGQSTSEPEIIERAAWAAYVESRRVHGLAPEERPFRVQIIEWLAVARAVKEVLDEGESVWTP